MSSEEPVTAKTIQDLVAANKDVVRIIRDRNGGWSRELLKIALPIVLTALLGFWVWYLQTKIQKTVDENKELLSTRLALSEALYKRKLSWYENASKEIAQLREALERLEDQAIDPALSTAAADSIRAIDDLRKSDLLYMSDDFKKDLADLWGLGMDRMQYSGEQDEATKLAMKKVDDEVALLGKHMKADLKTESLSAAFGGPPDSSRSKASPAEAKVR